MKIVIGNNASEMEIEGADAIVENLFNLTVNMPVIQTAADNMAELAGHNMTWVGGADNEVLEGVYDMTGTMRVTDDVNIMVGVFSGIPFDDVEQIIARHDGVTNSIIKSTNVLVVAIPGDAIIKRTNEDRVRRVEQVSSPPVDETNTIMGVGL